MKLPQKMVRLLDYTDFSDSEVQVRKMAREVHSPLGAVAAVCVYPRYVSLLKDAFVHLKLPVLSVATVVNFPGGRLPIDEVIAEIHYALQQGADEIDLVLPRSEHDTHQEFDKKLDFVRACRNETHGKVFKLIIESGELSLQEIQRSCEIGVTAGVDFLQTSTGKTPMGATPEAAEIMLNYIKNSGKHCGFKASGGIRSQTDAEVYITLAEKIMGSDFLGPQTFRLGASTLLKTLQEVLSVQDKV